MASVGELLGLGQGLVLLTYFSGVLIMSLPIPWRETKAWAPTLMKDAIMSEFALISVSVVQLLMSWISKILEQTIGTPFNSEPVAMALIISQLAALDAAFLLLISALSATVVLAPVANALSSVLGPALTWTTIAIVVWSMLQTALLFLPQVWLSIYIFGIVFMAIPLRLGRKFGALLMSSSVVAAIGLPLMPSFAIWLEGYVGYTTAIGPLQNIFSQIRSNPFLIGQFLATLPQALGGLFAAVVISLVVFPFAYLFILSILTRSLSNLLGGTSSGPLVSDYVTTSSREIGSTIVRSENQ